MQTLSLRKTYKKYPEYKDSGVEWLGKVPEEWNAEKIVSIFDFPDEKVTELNFEPLSVTYGGIKKQLETAAKVAEGSSRKLVKVGDIVINARSDRKGAVGMSPYEGAVSLVYNVLRKRNKTLDSRYFHYLFRSHVFSEEFYRWGRGIVDDLWTTRANEMKRIIIPVPSIESQVKIANYLDENTGFIDQIIEIKKKLIDLLKEKRTAIINQAVTKGLDPKAELVDSGIDWIGKIPKDWRLEKLKYVAPERNKKVVSIQNNGKYIGLENIESNTGNFISTEDEFQPESVVNEFNNGDVLFGKLRPYLAKVYTPNFDGVSTGELLDLVPKKNKISQRFLFYKLISKGFIKVVDDSTYGTKMPRASWNFIGNQKICLPTADEQKKIVDILDKNISFIDLAISKTEKSIEMLNEFKSSLISNVVTGKVNV